MKISSASSTRSLTCWAPWTSIFRMTSWPSASASRTSSRGVPYQLPWTSLASSRPPASRSSRNSLPVEEVVADAVDLARSRSARRAGHDVVVVRVARAGAQRVDDRVLPHPARSRDDHELGAGRARRDLGRRWRGGRGRRIERQRPGPVCARSESSTRSSSSGSGAVARMRWPSDGAASSSRQACRNSRPRPSGPRREIARAVDADPRRPGGRWRRGGRGSGGSGRSRGRARGGSSRRSARAPDSRSPTAARRSRRPSGSGASGRARSAPRSGPPRPRPSRGRAPGRSS